MEALIYEKPEKVICLGEKLLNLYVHEEEEGVLQYTYALMGKAGYILKNYNIAETYLENINVEHLNKSTYFYKSTKEIESSILLSKLHSIKEGREEANE